MSALPAEIPALYPGDSESLLPMVTHLSRSDAIPEIPAKHLARLHPARIFPTHHREPPGEVPLFPIDPRLGIHGRLPTEGAAGRLDSENRPACEIDQSRPMASLRDRWHRPHGGGQVQHAA